MLVVTGSLNSIAIGISALVVLVVVKMSPGIIFLRIDIVITLVRHKVFYIWISTRKIRTTRQHFFFRSS
jgi:hypothetical protein